MDTNKKNETTEPDRTLTKPKEPGETDSKRLEEAPARPDPGARPDLDWTDHED